MILLGMDLGSVPGLGRFPGEGNGNPLFPGEFHGQNSSWGCKELDMTEQLTFSIFKLKQGSERVSDSPKVTQLVSGRGRILTEACQNLLSSQ